MIASPAGLRCGYTDFAGFAELLAAAELERSRGRELACPIWARTGPGPDDWEPIGDLVITRDGCELRGIEPAEITLP